MPKRNVPASGAALLAASLGRLIGELVALATILFAIASAAILLAPRL